MEEKTIQTPYGLLAPQYEDDGVRRKYKRSVTYYPDGMTESVELKEQTLLDTPVGPLPAEHVIFYPSGNLKRVFPLNGKITGYWTEEDEFGLAQPLVFSFPFGKVEAKVIGIYFYDGGGIKSLTLWPTERITVPTGLGEVPVRCGVSFYENGAVASCEPARPFPVTTPLGNIRAFDPTALGVNGDKNSLELTEAGELKALVTSLDQVEGTSAQGGYRKLAPAYKLNLFNPEVMDLLPLRLAFQEGQVLVNHKLPGKSPAAAGFSLEAYTFSVTPYQPPSLIQCSSCANCTHCG